jgi:hypothetical protein
LNLFVFILQEAMLPKVVDNSYDFGVVDRSVFGAEIPIGSSVNSSSIQIRIKDLPMASCLLFSRFPINRRPCGVRAASNGQT